MQSDAPGAINFLNRLDNDEITLVLLWHAIFDGA
jgi:hypothetical protein